MTDINKFKPDYSPDYCPYLINEYKPSYQVVLDGKRQKILCSYCGVQKGTHGIPHTVRAETLDAMNLHDFRAEPKGKEPAKDEVTSVPGTSAAASEPGVSTPPATDPAKTTSDVTEPKGKVKIPLPALVVASHLQRASDMGVELDMGKKESQPSVSNLPHSHFRPLAKPAAALKHVTPPTMVQHAIIQPPAPPKMPPSYQGEPARLYNPYMRLENSELSPNPTLPSEEDAIPRVTNVIPPSRVFDFSTQTALPVQSRDEMDKIPLLDGHVLTPKQTRAMVRDAGIPFPLNFFYWEANAVYRPKSDIDQRLVADTNVKRVDKPLRLRIVKFLNWRVLWSSMLLAVSIVLLALSPWFYHAIDLLLHHFQVPHQIFDYLSPYTLAHWIPYLVMCSLCARNVVRLVRDMSLGLWLKVHYVPHILSSLHKEVGVKATWETEQTNIMSRIRRLAALPIADRDSSVLIEGSTMAFKQMLDKQSFLTADPLSHLILTPPTGRCTL